MAITTETFVNPAKFTEELTSKLKDYILPGIDLDAVVAGQRNNVEALAKASRAAFEGAQASGQTTGRNPSRDHEPDSKVLR